MKNNIDVVILWVDEKDQNWLNDYTKFLPKEKNQSNSEIRYRCWNCLEYIFRSFEYFIPWVNKVHFVTYGHLPSWLNVEHPKLNIVNHKDIIPIDHIPTFNSNSIEVNLNKIESLSENFILFNDDTFILKPLSSDRFFVQGKPVDFLNLSIKRKGWIYEKLKSKNLLSTNAINKNISIINSLIDINTLNEVYLVSNSYDYKSKLKNILFKSYYKEFSWFRINHVPQPHLKSTFNQLWSSNESDLYKTSESKFRTQSDTTQYLFRYFNLAKGNFYPKIFKDTLSINIQSSEDMIKMINKLKNVNLLSITDTDNLTNIEFYKSVNIFQKYLNTILPYKSSFEL